MGSFINLGDSLRVGKTLAHGGDVLGLLWGLKELTGRLLGLAGHWIGVDCNTFRNTLILYPTMANCGRATNYDYMMGRNLYIYSSLLLRESQRVHIIVKSGGMGTYNCVRQCPVTLQTSREFQRKKLD